MINTRSTVKVGNIHKRPPTITWTLFDWHQINIACTNVHNVFFNSLFMIYSLAYVSIKPSNPAPPFSRFISVQVPTILCSLQSETMSTLQFLHKPTHLCISSTYNRHAAPPLIKSRFVMKVSSWDNRSASCLFISFSSSSYMYQTPTYLTHIHFC